MIFTEGKSMQHCASDAGILGIFHILSSNFLSAAYNGKVRRSSVYKLIQAFSNATILEIDTALTEILDDRLTLPQYFQLVYILIDINILSENKE